MMTTNELPMATVSSAFDAARKRVQRLHDERARLRADQLTAEDAYIRRAAAEHQAGHLDWWGLIEVYDQVRDWGISGFSRRWLQHIPHDRNALLRFARALPRNGDGSWDGFTGWEGMDDALLPARGTEVVYILFDAARTPTKVGNTNQFRAHLKRLHTAGVTWDAWLAYPAATRADALEMRKLAAKRWNWTNAASSDHLSTSKETHGKRIAP